MYLVREPNSGSFVSIYFPIALQPEKQKAFFTMLRHTCAHMYQGCQMAYFQTKNRNLGKFRRALQWNMLEHIMDIWFILRPFDIFYGHLVYFVVIWYIFPRVGKLY
jgi:hypothetical protein